ncbi:MAG TPA: glutamine amidotransferase [Gemmataceae bacterium]|nr:glutamine amidotransferase [Gemmataceae bacterium]
MNVVIDPLWPWSHLPPFLASVTADIVAALVLSGLVAFALPILWQVRPFGWSPRQLVRGGGALLAMLLGWIAIHTWNSTSTPGGRGHGLAMAALVVLPLALLGVTIATYLGSPGATRRRTAMLLALRLSAFLLAALAIMRPALAFAQRNQLRSLLLIVCDYSGSMTIQDESNHQARWELLLQTLRESAPELDRLREEQQVDVRFYKFAGDVVEFQPNDAGAADGKRTDTGAMLRALYDGRDGQQPLRYLLLLSDGADNGSARTPALAEAGRWRGLPCPIHAFACGNPTTADRQNDVAIVSVATEPALVPSKGKLTVKLGIDAPGFENRTVRVRMFLDNEEVLARDEVLMLTNGNMVKLECSAPAKSGEVKLRVQVDDPKRPDEAPAGDLFPLNNKIETFVTVTKEGVSVLLVDKQRAMEPQFICDALTKDPRIRVTPVWLRGGQTLDANSGDLFRFDKQQYDVIIVGDVTAAQMRAVSPQALQAIEHLVEQGAGFLMLGGYSSFGNSDWQNTPIEKMLPIDLSNSKGQVEEDRKMLPTRDGLDKFAYILRLADGKDPKKAWENLPELEGISRLRKSEKGLQEAVLAVSDKGEPILIAQVYGTGRVLAFAGDTTHRWIINPDKQRMHSRFWRQVVLWLAKQENAEGSVWIKPDTRRLPAHSDLGFSVGVRSKGGVDLKDGTYTVEVAGPGGVKSSVPTAQTMTEDRGTFIHTDAPGEYLITVHGKATDPSTGEVVQGEQSAHFIVYDEDMEMSRRAADHDFLKKLAAAGGGDYHRVEELPAFLRRMQTENLARNKPKLTLRPDWRTAGRSAFFPLFFLLFVLLLSIEWLLRRRWGMV